MASLRLATKLSLESAKHSRASKTAKAQAPSSKAQAVSQALSLDQAQTAQVAQAETGYRTRATRHPLIGRTVEVLFRMIDGSDQSFAGHIVMVEPSRWNSVTEMRSRTPSNKPTRASFQKSAQLPRRHRRSGHYHGRKHDDEQGGKETQDQRALKPGTV